ncbi:Cadherin domain-containing protein,putative calcium-binding protein [Rivularia sp. PCC 7116]|uniref:beta strand repeat-containing protein n=1 Tax=Rivularia sp. PCC 7116 TaxID=373994 RepID=UPI00029F1578|nr:choice-of-anchor Q domain-containing protein [Rivularia sp. PCC 7116]AFY55137.1 Cadherin domain-containing protein,putative calcium-binding protein [Rivularia sp. PCC 7116]
MAATVLNPGDIAIVGYITNGSPDSFSFVPLVDLSAGTEIYFTDSGWKGNEFRDTEGTKKFTVDNDIAAGTVIRSTEQSSDFTWENVSRSLNLSGSGDQIAAVQSNNLDSPLSSDFTAIYQVDYTGSFEDADTASTGNIITGLSEAENTAVLLNDTAKYAYFDFDAIPNGTREDWLATINNPENWTFSDDGTTLPSGSIEVISEVSANNLVVTNTNDSGEGSLRQAIENANNLEDVDTITFDASLSGETITLTSGELLVTDAVTIQGLGANQITISGNNSSRIFKIDNNDSGNQIDVTIDSLSITGGQTPEGDDANDDGAGIWNRENLTLKNVVIRNNQAADDGGGIRNDGEITIIDSTVADNTSIGTSDTSGGGGLLNTIGASATVINSTFSNNEAKNGAGIRNDDNLTLINSTLSGNTASESGGGLANTINPNDFRNPASGGKATISNSTITNNTAEDSSGNGANSQVGGGIANFGIATVSNSIIAKNTNDDDFKNLVFGQSNSNGNNLIGNGEGVAAFTNGNNEDIVGTAAAPIDPLLDVLKDNGGATQTHALLADSQAINAGSNTKLVGDSFDLDGDGNTTEQIPFEQRAEGFERIVDSVVDIGAYEYSIGNTASQAPGITANQSFPIDENSKKGTFVGRVIATDPDSNTLSNWQIIDGNLDVDGDGKDAFAINSRTGNITVNDADDLDFENNPSFQLQLSVSDGTNTSNPATVTINLNDVAGSEINGTSENDRLNGSPEDDVIDGKEGNDFLYGYTGNDTLLGGSGNDNLYGGEGDDSINGGDGTDTLRETADVDFNLTNTTLTGNGTDTFENIERVALTGGDSANTINASAYSGRVTLSAKAGNDTLIGGIGNDVLSGGEGDDSINGGAGTDTLRETADTNFTLTNNQLESAATGIDTFENIERVALTGGDSANTIDASAYSGSAFLYGKAGNDTLIGGSGNDVLSGGEGDDSINGGAGTDTLRETADTNFTLTNNQLESAATGTDTFENIERVALTGGDSANTINASAYSGRVTLSAKAGNDTLIGWYWK